MVERQASDEHPPDDANGTTDEHRVQDILALAGCWSDLMWDVVEKELDRIRNDSKPSSPLIL